MLDIIDDEFEQWPESLDAEADDVPSELIKAIELTKAIDH